MNLVDESGYSVDIEGFVRALLSERTTGLEARIDMLEARIETIENEKESNE